MNDWDGKWWAESLEGVEQELFENFIFLLETADKSEFRLYALQLFQMGHKHGYNLAYDLARD